MKIKVGSDFSGVGAFNQALMRLGIQYEEVFACDMDKYARDTFIHNYGEPKYYPTNVYDREIPAESLDIYMTSPPCQAFSLAGKRLGKDDKRGILFFNSLEFIQVNKPRFFIFENVKGLLSDDGGKTFNEWVNLLGGKSVNGAPVLFPYEDSVPYHLYWKVLNAKNYGVPQNRERVFLIGIRDDEDNKFNWPIEEVLTKRLKDVLEEQVDDKYFLSRKMIDGFTKHNENHNEKGTGFIFEPKKENDIANCLRANAALCPTDNTLQVESKEMFILGYTRDKNGKVTSRNIWEQAGTIHTSSGGGGNTDQFVMQYNDREIEDENCPTIPAMAIEDGSGQPVVKINCKYGFYTCMNYDLMCNTCDEGSNYEIGYNDKRLNETISKNKLFKGEYRILETYNNSIYEECPTLKAIHAQNNDRKLWDEYQIRRLTPRECFRLMDFPDTFTWAVSDSQAYKQAGNSIVVAVLSKIISNLPIINK